MSTSRGENRREASRMMSICRLKRRHPLQPTSSTISVGGVCRIDAFARHFSDLPLLTEESPPGDSGWAIFYTISLFQVLLHAAAKGFSSCGV
jgi:hypothetical protein